MNNVGSRTGNIPADLSWWHHAVIYQVYLRSFQDSNSDGEGDLAGLISRLDYIASLGVDGIWLPIDEQSPSGKGSLSLIRLMHEASKRRLKILTNLAIEYNLTTSGLIDKPRRLKAELIASQAQSGWPTVALESPATGHYIQSTDDHSRRQLLAKMMAVINMTLRGTPLLYQGQEIGLANLDPMTIKKQQKVSSQITPGCSLMQWDDSDNAGFSDVQPWLSVNHDYHTVSVAAEDNPGSVLSFYRQMIAARKSHLILQDGEVRFIDDHKAVLSYLRVLGNETMLIVVNLSPKLIRPRTKLTGQLVANSYHDDASGDGLVLQPYQAVILRI